MHKNILMNYVQKSLIFNSLTDNTNKKKEAVRISRSKYLRFYTQTSPYIRYAIHLSRDYLLESSLVIIDRNGDFAQRVATCRRSPTSQPRVKRSGERAEPTSLSYLLDSASHASTTLRVSRKTNPCHATAILCAACRHLSMQPNFTAKNEVESRATDNSMRPSAELR